VVVRQIGCSPAGQVLTVEQAEDLRNVLAIAIESARATSPDEPLVIVDRNGPDWAHFEAPPAPPFPVDQGNHRLDPA
jgi:hypothetical protein